MESGSVLQPDPQRLPEDVQKGVPHAVETAENAAESEEKVTELCSSEQRQPEEAQHEQDVEKQPRPTTSTADSHSASVDSRDGARQAGSLDSAVEEGEDRRYLPVWKQDGAGSYKVHTIPQKLLESLTTHDIVVVWSQLKYEIGKKIWGTGRFEPVPTVVEGAVDRYELGAVLFKSRRSSREKWQCLPPKCQAIASIYDLIWDHDLSVDAAVEIAAPLRMRDDKPWPNHRFHGIALKGGYCRQVTVTTSGCHRVTPRALPQPDSLVLNLYRFSGRYKTDRIYVITEVIYAEELHVGVRVSINRDDVKILHRVPLGFKLHSYDVKDLSTLMRRRPYGKPLRVRWIGLTDTEHPSIFPRRTRGMGDVNKRLDINRRNHALELFPNRPNRNNRNVDNGGDRQGQLVAN